MFHKPSLMTLALGKLYPAQCTVGAVELLHNKNMGHMAVVAFGMALRPIFWTF